jgi:hypothetical protein
MKSNKSISSTMHFASLFTFLLLTPSLRAQDVTTQSAGGTGGDPFTVGCGSDKAMVGLQIRTGDHGLLGLHINMVRPVCVSVDAGGDWLGTPTPASSVGGKDTGDFASAMCRKGEAVSALDSAAGMYVDGIYIYCSSIGEYGRLNNDQYWVQTLLGYHPMPLESYTGPLSCPSTKPAKGLSGRAHDWLDRISLICNFPSTPSANVDAISFVSPIIGGNPLHGTITLNASAPSGGLQVSISRQYDVTDAAFVPSDQPGSNSFTVPSGSRTGSFVLNTIPVPHVVDVKLNPGPGSATHFVTKTLSILPPSLTTLSLSLNATSPGGNVTGTITLNGNAPIGGLSASLTSSIASVATVPPSALITSGVNTATFPITVASSNQSGCSVISASGLFTPQGGNPVRQSLLKVKGPLSPAFKFGVTNNLGSSATGNILFEQIDKAPGTLTLASSNPTLVIVPSTVPIPANSQTITFPITLQGRPPTGISCAVITATDAHGNANSIVFSIDAAGLRQ